jgi:PKD repeat protein
MQTTPAIEPTGSLAPGVFPERLRVQDGPPATARLAAPPTHRAPSGERWRYVGVAGIAVVFAGLLAVACLLPASIASAAVTPIGGPGVGSGTFGQPGADAVDTSGNLYVLDPQRGTLQKFSNTGAYIASISSANGVAFSFNLQGGLAIDGSNDIFVADWGNSRLIELDSSLNYVSTIASGAFLSIATGAGHIYTLDVTGGQYRVERYTAGTMDESKTFPVGSGPGDLAAPDHDSFVFDRIAVDSGGTVYVTDTDNQRVIELSSDLSTVLGPTLTGFTGYPRSIATGQVGGSTQVYVGDDNNAGNSFVRRFSPSGTQLGALPVQFAQGGLATDASGNVFDSEGAAGAAVLRIDTTPDPAIAAPTPGTGLTSQTVTFNGSAETDHWGTADYSWDLDGSGAFATDTGTTPTVSHQFNAPGTYPVGLRVTGTNGRVAQTTINYVVGNSGAAFTGPAQTLTNTAVIFDGTPSVIPYSSVTDYAWDFDGSGSYAVDGGASPTISHTFTTPGTYSVQLRVTRSYGEIDLASGTITVTTPPTPPPTPPPGPVGVSVNNGDFATDNPNVQVDLVWPSGATQVVLSNDGGFGPAGGTMTLLLTAQVSWTLRQTGPERLPTTVYVRFLGAGIDTQNFTDTIILDQTPRPCSPPR